MAIAGALSAFGCSAASSWEVDSGLAGAGAGGDAAVAGSVQQTEGGSSASGGLSEAAGAYSAGDAGSIDGPGSGGKASGGMGPIIKETGGDAGKPTVPECDGTFTQICPDIPGCVDLSKRECVGGKWSECKCLDECVPGAGRECVTAASVDGVQVCGAKAHWGECYPPPPGGPWPEHVLCHKPQVESGSKSTEYSVCVLSCYLIGVGTAATEQKEDMSWVKESPPLSAHCAQRADGCWRCP